MDYSIGEGRRVETMDRECCLGQLLSSPSAVSTSVHTKREFSDSDMANSSKFSKILAARTMTANVVRLRMETGGRFLTWRAMVCSLVFTSLLFWVLLQRKLFHGTMHPTELVRGRIRALKVAHFPVQGNPLQDSRAQKQMILFVADAVTFPDEVLLLVQSQNGEYLPGKDDYECVFKGNQRTSIHAMGFKEPELMYVRCPRPSNRPLSHDMKPFTVTLGLKGSQALLQTEAQYPYKPSWERLVYETLVQRDSVILFVKGLYNRRQSKSLDISRLRCVFGDIHEVSTWVRIVAQETRGISCAGHRGLIISYGVKSFLGTFSAEDHAGIEITSPCLCVRDDSLQLSKAVLVIVVGLQVVRCNLPHLSLHQSLVGKKVSIRSPRLGVLPSVAYFYPPSFRGTNAGGGKNQTLTFDSIAAEENSQIAGKTTTGRASKKHFICACTMIWNQARFLKEWIMYHSYLGVERWYLYDNNSDDELEEVLSEFLAKLNVTRHIWPWLKTQEAGFAHCALRAQTECEWVMFTDVDEFIYPARYLDGKMSSDQSSILKRLIKTEIERVWGARGSSHVGEIRLDCHNFGPTGLIQHPEEGVMVGYTCRMNTPQRHKSFLRVDALNESLLNVVHHFDLKTTFRPTALHRNIAVINHYKYQVWDVFKTKFYRRVATYVTDWRLKQNEGSKDRVPGLGTEPVEPLDWPDRFCQVVDLGLRNFTLQTFQHPHTHQLLWQ